MENTREKIIASAFSFYTKPVIESVSLSSIASRAGITKPAIYRHFKSRQELDEVMVERVFKDLYEVLTKITPQKGTEIPIFVEDLIVLLLTHKEYFFYLISTQIDFALDKVLMRFKKMGLCFFDSIFATDGSVINIEKYKTAIFLGGNIMFFDIIYSRVTAKYNIESSYSDVVSYAGKISSFLGKGLGQDVSSLTMSRLATLDNICSSSMAALKPADKVFLSVSDIVKEKGFNGITVESVAHGIGLAKSSIYSKFENKTQMICSLVQKEFEGLYQSIEKNIGFAETNAERAYVLMETVLVFFMKKPEVLNVARWLQFHSVDEILQDNKYEEKIYRKYFDGIVLCDKFPELELPVEDKKVFMSWCWTMPIVLYMHAKNQKISPDVVQAMLKDILFMMEKGMGDRNEI